MMHTGSGPELAGRRLAAILICSAPPGGSPCARACPPLDGQRHAFRSQRAVSIERDAAGVPTITAQNRERSRARLGYVHGQDRYFQMDLLRRAAAGELSALFGPSLLSADRQLRLHRFRGRGAHRPRLPDASTRALLDAYAAGVNAGLPPCAAVRSNIGSCKASRSRGAPKTACSACMRCSAAAGPAGHGQLQRGLLRATLPDALWRFLLAGAPEWDAAIDGSRSAEPRVPSAEEFDLRGVQGLPAGRLRNVAELDQLGSNNWAVAGSHTSHGAAMVANDMHLDFRVPNIWYRARLVHRGDLDLTGVTLPGTPSIVAGSNRHIAWGFTNSYGAFETVVRLVPAPNDPRRTKPRRVRSDFAI